MQKLQLKCERKQAETHKAVSEKNAQESNLKHRDSLIESLQKQSSQMKEDHRMLEHQLELQSRAKQDAERQYDCQLREEKDRHGREIERLEKRLRAEETKLASQSTSYESRMQAQQAELFQAHAEAKQSTYALSQEKLALMAAQNQCRLHEKELHQA